MMKTRIYITFLVFSFCIMGCVSMNNQAVQAPTNQNLWDTAKEMMGEVFEHYQHFSRGYFSDIVSQDFSPNALDFIDGVNKRFNKGNILEMDYSVDQVLPGAGKFSVSFNWEKKVQYYNKKGLTLKRGQAQFVFNKEAGGWRLSQVGGQSPF